MLWFLNRPPDKCTVNVICQRWVSAWAISVVLVVGNACADAPRVEPRSSGGKSGAVGIFPDQKMMVADLERKYRLVVPKGLPEKGPVPLVFAFHGFLIDSKDLMAAYSGLDQLASAKKFILVYPNGNGPAWPLLPVLAQKDLAYFDSLVKKITSEYNVDLNRIYLTGMSNGAYFSHLVAQARSETVAAIAAHSGGMPGIKLAEPKEGRQYAALLIHGAKDEIVKSEESKKAHDVYKALGYETQFIEVPNHGHLWARFQVNDKIWKFFEEHPKVRK
jgi:polyhydroxybutyrate depolymerase